MSASGHSDEKPLGLHHHPLNESQPGFPFYARPRANPGPLGLFCFASTVLLLSFINVQARGLTEPNIVVGMAFSLGGLAQFVAGIFEFVVGNTFGMTAFCSYGAFWLSMGLLFWPSSGMIAAYDAEGLNSALGLFLIPWIIFTVILLMATLRSSVGLLSLFAILTVSLLLLDIGYFLGSVPLLKAGGYVGIITGLNAYYVAGHGLLTAEAAPFNLPNPSLAPAV